MTAAEAIVYVADDDDAVRVALKDLLESVGLCVGDPKRLTELRV